MSANTQGKRLTRASAYLITISAVILVGTEVIGIAAATAWALGGLLQLGVLLTWILGAVMCVAAAWITWIFARNAWSVEKEGLSELPASPRAQQ
ncbi:MAG: hypothetical protein JJU21_00135 [Salinarimonas sp.]|nr:hypothetical protein [Salinarimonas sp.]